MPKADLRSRSQCDGTVRVRRSPQRREVVPLQRWRVAARSRHARSATTDPNVGVAKVPDPRLDRLAEMASSAKVVPASVQFVDIGGLVEGASEGEGLGNRFLAHIREVDLVVYVLRAFEDTDVPGPTDPLDCLRIIETELALADLETVQNQIEKRRKAAKQDRTIVDEVAALDKALALLSEGTPVYRGGLGPAERELLRLLPPHEQAGHGGGEHR